MRNLQIPPGIQPGDTIKMPRMGVPDMNKPSVRGDHHFVIQVLIPKDIRFLTYLICEAVILFLSVIFKTFDLYNFFFQ